MNKDKSLTIINQIRGRGGGKSSTHGSRWWLGPPQDKENNWNQTYENIENNIEIMHNEFYKLKDIYLSLKKMNALLETTLLMILKLKMPSLEKSMKA